MKEVEKIFCKWRIGILPWIIGNLLRIKKWQKKVNNNKNKMFNFLHNLIKINKIYNNFNQKLRRELEKNSKLRKIIK
jgi:hypothetical protein